MDRFRGVCYTLSGIKVVIMCRNNFKEMLGEYAPEAGEEGVAKEEILSFVERYPDCFERSLEVGHITASAWLLSRDLSKVLLMHHAKLDMWVQLGGHCDGDPDVLGVAIREAQEESGIQGIRPINKKIFDLDIHLIPENSREKAHFHYDIRFLLLVMGDEEPIQNWESKSLCWFGKDILELPTKSPSILRMFHKWVALGKV